MIFSDFLWFIIKVNPGLCRRVIYGKLSRGGEWGPQKGPFFMPRVGW